MLVSNGFRKVLEALIIVLFFALFLGACSDGDGTGVGDEGVTASEQGGQEGVELTEEGDEQFTLSDEKGGESETGTTESNDETSIGEESVTDPEGEEPEGGEVEPDPPSAGMSVDSVDPSSGAATGGETVSVTGKGFENGAVVYFGESEAQNILFLDSTQILCDTPPRPPGVVDIMVINPPPAEDIPGETAVLGDGFLFFNPVQVLSVDPVEGSVEGGLPVTVSGSGFIEGTKILFGTSAAISVNVVSDSEILALTPLGSPGTVNVHASNSDGLGTLTGGFFYFAMPEVSIVAPPNGPIEGGNTVSIIGEGFIGEPQVRFGGADVESVEVVSTSLLNVVAPPGEEGSIDVEVETDYGIAILFGGYTYVDVANATGETLLLGVSPSAGPFTGGTDVYLTAHGLTTAADTEVLFADQQAEVVSVNPVTMTVHAKTPATEGPGWVSVTLTNSNGSSVLDGAFAYEHAIEIDAVTPGVGPISGGTSITVLGSGFITGSEVRVGALPAIDVQIIDDGTIQAVTPPGSGGFVPVTVKAVGVSGEMEDGFFYQGEGMDLYLVTPSQGSIAGGTLVSLVGTGFPGNAEVFVGGVAASHITVVDSTLIRAKTPPGQVGTVTVEVKSPQGDAILPDAFTYYNPASALGGTWGSDIEGTLNVTVLDISNSAPIPDAFVILYTDPTTPYQGFTNLQGQITFSGPGVGGDEMASASKVGYESNSVIDFDAENITIYLTPIPDPSSGTPPPGIPPPMVSGKLHGLDKYTIVPIGSCANKLGSPWPLCQSCTDDAQCGGGGNKCSVLSPDSLLEYCTTACSSPADCPQGFSCGSVEGVGQCLPSPGEKHARCYPTKPHIFEYDIWHPEVLGAPGPNGEWEVEEEGEYYTVFAYPGETAVVCFGGYIDYDTGEFVPLTLGVARHVFTAPGETSQDQDIELKHQMDRDITVVFDNPPIGPPDFQGIFTYMDFGTDGVIEMDHALTTSAFGYPLVIPRQVREFSGDIYDATFTFLGGGFSATPDNTPMSLVLAREVTSIEDDTIFSLDEESWDGYASGIKATIHDMWGTSDVDIFGVGADGLIIHNNGGGWTPQPSPMDVTLNGVFGFSSDNVYAVGDSGSIVHFDGVNWVEQPVSGLNSPLRGIWGASPNDVYAVGQFAVAHYDGTSWSFASLGLPTKDFQSIHGVGTDHVWVVAKGGWVYSRSDSGANWVPKQLDHKKDLLGVWAASTDSVFAVGANGTISHYNGVVWADMDSGVEQTLHAVWGSASDDVYAVGERGTIVHYDGEAWSDQSPGEYDKSFVAIWGASFGHAVATGSHEFVLTPFLEVPIPVYPADGGVMDDYQVTFNVKEGGFPASLHYLRMTIPSMFGPIPVWLMVTDGNVTEFNLPEFPDIEGTPGIPNGGLDFLILRGYKPGFDIDNYDYTDFNQLEWRAWSVDVYSFIKQ